MTSETNFLIALFPVAFMIHEFEEIIMLKPWLTKNREVLQERFPEIAKFLEEYGLFELSTSAFAASFNWWFAVFMAYFVHLFIHLIQWVVYKKYIPVVLTTILTMPYCFYTIVIFFDEVKMSFKESIVWTFVGIIFLIIGVFSALFLAVRFEKWKNMKYYS